ncbi:MAG: hypothetical protein SGARI_003141 [Bacillariaceae sp.]
MVQFVKAAGDKYIVHPFNVLDGRMKVNPQNCKTPEALLYSPADLLPAPSLEDMPPERGTILELCNINDEYDGTLVEFWRVEERSGKYFVQVLKDDDNAEVEGMRVKAQCCQRPMVKPLALRQMLTKLVRELGRLDKVEMDLKESRTRQLLMYDKCCIPALALITTVSNKRNESLGNEEVDVSVYVKYMRRALANSHLYQDADEFCRKLELSLAAQYAAWLSHTSRHKSLLRMQQKLQSASSHQAHPRWIQYRRAVDNQNLATSLMTAAQKHHGPNERYARELNTFLRASGLFFKFLKWCANGENYIGGLDTGQRNDLKEKAACVIVQ